MPMVFSSEAWISHRIVKSIKFYVVQNSLISNLQLLTSKLDLSVYPVVMVLQYCHWYIHRKFSSLCFWHPNRALYQYSLHEL